MKTLKNISVIILFLGLIFLTVYVTKSYYVFNDIQYKEIVNKLLAEEKKRAIDSEVTRQDKLPSNMFEIMFNKPSPWMGYSDDLTKDFNKKDKEQQQEITILEEENKKFKKEIVNVNNKLSIIKNIVKENKKDEEKLNKDTDSSLAKLFSRINILQKNQDSIIDEINFIKSEIRDLDSQILKTDPNKNDVGPLSIINYKRKVIKRKILDKKLQDKYKNYSEIKKLITKAKKSTKDKDNSTKTDSIKLLGTNLLNQQLKLTKELSNLSKKLEKNNNKIKGINSIASFQINQ